MTSQENSGAASSSTRVLRTLSSETEVLNLFPGSFLLAYERLWVKAFGESRAEKDPDAQVAKVKSGARVRTSSGQADARGAARSGGKRQGAANRNVIKDQRAQAIKAGVDRKLRKMARELNVFLGGGDVKAGARRCVGRSCRKFAEDEWNYCPWCGYATEEID